MATPLASVALLEGPVATRDSELLVADVVGNRIWRIAADGTADVFREDSGRAIGNAWDLDGRLLTCEGAELGPGGRRRLTRTDLSTGAVEVLVDSFEGRRLNSPNDVTCDERGLIYFTDPRYGSRHDLELEHESVYRLDPDGTLRRLVTQPAIERPNGLAVAPDGSLLYVVDSNHDVGGNRIIWAFELDERGEVGDQRAAYDFAPGRGGDGIAVDVEGNLYVCAGVLRPRWDGETADVPPGVYVISPSGNMLDVIEVSQDLVTNCCFGGADMRTLFVTAGNLVLHARVAVAGYQAGNRDSLAEARRSPSIAATNRR